MRFFADRNLSNTESSSIYIFTVHCVVLRPLSRNNYIRPVVTPSITLRLDFTLFSKRRFSSSMQIIFALSCHWRSVFMYLAEPDTEKHCWNALSVWSEKCLSYLSLAAFIHLTIQKLSNSFEIWKSLHFRIGVETVTNKVGVTVA